MDMTVDQPGRQGTALGVDRHLRAGGIEVALLAHRHDAALVGDDRIGIEDRTLEIAGQHQSDVADHHLSCRSAGRHWICHGVTPSDYRNPSSPLISCFCRPPTRGKGRPESVMTMATRISLARGASAMRTSMPSKWLRTKAASLWPSGTSTAVPMPPIFLAEGIRAAPLLRT